MDQNTLQAALGQYFAPWVQALDIKATAFDTGSVTLSLINSPQLCRVGGMMCGQALMAAADTAQVLALMCYFGEFRPCTTVQMNSSFFKPLSGQDALIHAQVLRAGKNIAFGEISIYGANDQKLVFKSSTTYALL